MERPKHKTKSSFWTVYNYHLVYTHLYCRPHGRSSKHLSIPPVTASLLLGATKTKTSPAVKGAVPKGMLRDHPALEAREEEGGPNAPANASQHQNWIKVPVHQKPCKTVENAVGHAAFLAPEAVL